MQTCNMVQAGYGEADITPDNPSEMVGFYRPDNRSRYSARCNLYRAGLKQFSNTLCNQAIKEE